MPIARAALRVDGAPRRGARAAQPLRSKAPYALSFSSGFSVLEPPERPTLNDLLESADRALYASKRRHPAAGMGREPGGRRSASHRRRLAAAIRSQQALRPRLRTDPTRTQISPSFIRVVGADGSDPYPYRWPVAMRRECMLPSRSTLRESGGTGRRAGLRIQWPKGRGGSTPPFRTSRLTQSLVSSRHRQERHGCARRSCAVSISLPHRRGRVAFWGRAQSRGPELPS